MSKRDRSGSVFGGTKGHGTPEDEEGPVEEGIVEVNEGPVEDVVCEQADDMTDVEVRPRGDDFEVCKCDHSTRASGFCTHGNNI
jgi:hypothetical protein